jgi:hypothetical protein
MSSPADTDFAERSVAQVASLTKNAFQVTEQSSLTSGVCPYGWVDPPACDLDLIEAMGDTFIW